MADKAILSTVKSDSFDLQRFVDAQIQILSSPKFALASRTTD